MDALRAAYISAAPRLPVGYTFEQFKASVRDWEIIPVSVMGQMAGAILAKGPDIHACILPEFHKRWITPSLWRAVFIERQREFGFLRTTVEAGNAIGCEFVERAGFKSIGTENGIMIYERSK